MKRKAFRWELILIVILIIILIFTSQNVKVIEKPIVITKTVTKPSIILQPTTTLPPPVPINIRTQGACVNWENIGNAISQTDPNKVFTLFRKRCGRQCDFAVVDNDGHRYDIGQNMDCYQNGSLITIPGLEALGEFKYQYYPLEVPRYIP